MSGQPLCLAPEYASTKKNVFAHEDTHKTDHLYGWLLLPRAAREWLEARVGEPVGTW